MKRMCCFTLFFILLSACGGLYLDDDTDRRDDGRRGDVKLPTDLIEQQSFLAFLKNCKPEFSSPDTVTDILTDTVGISHLNPFRRARECLKKKLEDGQNRICNVREELERKRERARDDIAKSRVENSIYKLEHIEFTFKQNLYKMALDIDKHYDRQKEKSKGYNRWGRFWNSFWRDEVRGVEGILDRESYNDCNIHSRDKK